MHHLLRELTLLASDTSRVSYARADRKVDQINRLCSEIDAMCENSPIEANLEIVEKAKDDISMVQSLLGK